MSCFEWCSQRNCELFCETIQNFHLFTYCLSLYSYYESSGAVKLLFISNIVFEIESVTHCILFTYTWVSIYNYTCVTCCIKTQILNINRLILNKSMGEKSFEIL